jgi:hypothetical protein
MDSKDKPFLDADKFDAASRAMDEAGTELIKILKALELTLQATEDLLDPDAARYNDLRTIIGANGVKDAITRNLPDLPKARSLISTAMEWVDLSITAAESKAALYHKQRQKIGALIDEL